MMWAQLSLLCLASFAHRGSPLPRDPEQVLFHAGEANTQELLGVRHELIKAEIIPTVIDDFIPSFLLSVRWSGDNTSALLGNTLDPSDLKSAPAIKLLDDPTSSSTSPRQLDHSASSSSSNGGGGCGGGIRYTIALTDPDAPSRDDPKWSEMCHWIGTNVTLSHSPSALLQPSRSLLSRLSSLFSSAISQLSHPRRHEHHHHRIDTVLSYLPPAPPPRTGKHRYVFLAFAPANRTTLPLHLTVPRERRHWGTGEERRGARDWARENGLLPVAANFVYAQNAEQ